MTDPLRRLQRFLAELKRRKVYRVAAGYLVAAFVILQVAGLAADAFGFPGWFEPMVWVVSALGLPIAVVLAWAFEMTPEGVRRTPQEPAGEGAGGAGGGVRTGYKVLVGLGLLAAAGAGAWYLTGGGGSAPRAGERSVAVLPFDPLGQQEAGTFTEGMHDALLTRLSNVSGLTVISRTSVQQYRNTDKTTPEIARELGVAWIVEGGVQEMGDQIQVNVQLIDPRTDTRAWVDSYRRDLTAQNLFEIQTEITKKVATSLEAQITTGEQRRVERYPTESLDAYRAYLRGRHQWNRHTEEAWRRAAEHFREAIASDSSYAPAHAGLADALIRLGLFGHEPPGEAYEQARRAARRALELDDQLAAAHTTLGRISYLYEWDFRGAESRFRRALELNPNYAQALHAYAVFLARMGRFREAMSRLEEALRLDPVMPRFNNNRGWIAFLARDSREAIAAYRSALELNPGFAMTHRELAWAYVEAGRHGKAVRAAERALELSPDDYTLASLGFVLGRAGEEARARTVLDSLNARAERRYVSPTNLALGHLGLGEWDRALDWLYRAADDRSSFLVNLGVHPFFDPLRGRPRFERLLERMGLDTVAVDLDTLASGSDPGPGRARSSRESVPSAVAVKDGRRRPWRSFSLQAALSPAPPSARGTCPHAPAGVSRPAPG